MSEALARLGDISVSNTWTLETLRDYFLGLIASNDRRYSEEAGNLREVIRLMDARYGERAEAQQRAALQVAVGFELGCGFLAVGAILALLVLRWLPR